MKKLLLGSLILLLTASLQAVDVDIYSKINMDAWWIRMERFYEGTVDTSINNDTVFSDDSLPVVSNSLFPSGKFGIKFNNDKITGCIELGVHLNAYKGGYMGGAETSSRFYLKEYKMQADLSKWYIEWFINDMFTLLIGKSTAPGCFFTSNQAFFGGNSFLNSGCLYTGKRPMLQIAVHDPNNIIEFKFAASKSDTFSMAQNEANDDYRYLGETKLPKLEGSFGLELEKNIFALSFKFAGGYQKYGFVGMHDGLVVDSARTEVHAYVIGATNKIKIGPITPSVSFFYGQNLGIYGVYVGDAFRWWQESNYIRIFYPSYNPNDKLTINNGRAFAINGVLNVKPIDLFSWEGGFGFVDGDHDYPPFSALWIPSYSWYNQVKFKILDHLEIACEIGQYIFGPYFGGGKYLYWGTGIGIDF